MMKKLKVAVIGGGSSYTPELIEGFIKRYNEFPINELFLVDIEEGREKLKTVGALAKRMIEKANLPIDLHLTFDRREAIKDAAFVSTQIRVGMLDARARDERIPLRYGFLGQETTGAGGFAKALRTVPVILDICKDIEELSPHAFLLNFTNPAGIVTEAVTKYTNVKTIGLCNLPIGNKMSIAKVMDVDVSKVDIEMVGINHLNWTTKVCVEGKDITKTILSIMSGAKGGTSVKNIPDIQWEPEFIQSVGMIPCSYLKYYYMKDKMVAKQLEEFETKGTRADEVKRVEEELFELYKNPELNVKPAQLEKRGGAYYSEAAVQLMTSIYNNKKDIQIVNVRNNGIIPCLPENVSVEVNCVIDSEGATPLQLKTTLPPHIRGLLQIVKAYEELTIEAAVHGDYHAGLQALTIHPLVGSSEHAKRIFMDVIKENNEFLPQFT